MISRLVSRTGRPAHGVMRSSKVPSGPDRVQHRQPFGPADLHVVVAEGRRQVDDARALVGADEVGGHHPQGSGRSIGQEVVRPAVVHADQVAPVEALDDVGALGHPGGGHDQVAAALGGPHPHVLDVGAHGGGHVGDERPGGGGPDQEVGLAADHREAEVDGRVDDVAVHAGLAQLVRRQGGAAAGAVGADPVALVQEPLVPQLAQQPPHRLDVGVVEGAVGVVGVDPDAGPLGEGLPVGHVALHRLAAAGVELGDAEGLDLVLVGEAQLLLDLDLHREPVAVPAALAGDVVAPHGLEAGEEVLEHPGPHVVEAGLAVGGGRALVEDPRRRPLAQRLDLLGQRVLPPPGQHSLLERDQVQLGVDGAKCHGQQ